MVKKITSLTDQSINHFKRQYLVGVFAFFLCVVCLFPLNIFAHIQPVQAFHDQTQIKRFLQDSNGFIWSLGQSGLKRFDGFETINFSMQGPYKLPFSWIKDALIVQNMMYIATENRGLWQLNLNNFKSKQLLNFEQASNLERLKFHADSLYILGREGFSQYNIAKAQYSILSKQYTSLFADVFGDSIYFSDENRMIKFHIKSGTYSVAATFKQKINEIVASNDVLMVTAGKHVAFLNNTTLSDEKDIQPAKLKIESPNAEYTKHFKAAPLTKVILPTPVSSATFTDETKEFLLSLSNGELITLSSKTFTRVANRYDIGSAKNATAMLIDRTNSLWIASSSGVSPNVKLPFRLHNIKFPVKNNEIDMLIANDIIWLGSNGAGLFRYDIDAKELIPDAIFNSAVPNARINEFSEHNGNLYIPTYEGVYKYTPETGRVSRLIKEFDDQLFLSSQIINDKLYLGCNEGGLAIVDLSTNTLIHHIKEGANELLSGEVLTASHVGSEIWVATAKGINVLNATNHTLKSTVTLPTHAKVIAVTAINNKIYVSTYGDGLYVLNQAGELINRLNTSSKVLSAKPLNSELYVTTREGLYIVDTTTDTFTQLAGSRQLTFSSPMFLHNDKLIGAGFFGLVEIPVKRSQEIITRPAITRITHNGNTLFNKHSLSLESSKDVVSFNLSSFDYRDSNAMRFKYRLNEGQWNEISGHSLTLTQLQPDDYLLEFKGANALGNWSAESTFARLTVLIPWYKTSLAITLYILIALITVALIIWVLQMKVKNAHNLQQLLSNEIYLKGHSIEQIKYNFNHIKQYIKSQNTAAIEQVCNDSLALLTKQQDEIVPSQLADKNLKDGLWYFANYLQEYFDVNITLDNHFSQSALPTDIQQDVYRMVYEAVSFAIHQSFDRSFNLRLVNVHSSFLIELFDEGEGLLNLKNELNSHLGLFILKSLIKKYQAKLDCSTHYNHGSYMCISFSSERIIPVHKEY
ncbi:ligand-binding sensor domain-containing protein [Flocculibacter collagenilyticus]|uniref:hypothetical protein n=1 Tax=Flocculibacter collagenilyticus TaxID=2744479 RepID=UPI0018F48622|nr:hypothetical protein [Flocculibacter collagenilyticus]